MRIGVCDDSATDRRMIKGWIVSNVPGIKKNDVIEFQNGWMLLDYLAHNFLDILCLDYMMQEINGIDTLRAIRADAGDVLVMLISNYLEYAHYCVEFNIFRYLLKPTFPGQAPDAFRKAIIASQQNEKILIG